MPKYNTTPEERQRWERFRADPLWTEWVATLGSNTAYPAFLFKFLGRLGVSPSEVIGRAKSDPASLSKRVKVLIAELRNRYDPSSLNNMLAALKHLLAFNDLALPLIGLKIKKQPKVRPFMSWSQADLVISKANLEYQPIYRVMQWGLDRERFRKLNVDKKRLANIKTQLQDEGRDWIKIEIPEGRKHSPPFYLLVPREVAMLLPVLDQHGKPFTHPLSISENWRFAMCRTFPEDEIEKYERFGPHNLRSVWMSEATRRKLDPVLRQFQLGHVVDSLHYQRLMQDEKWVIGEFRSAWQTRPAITHEELASRDARMGQLESENKGLKERLERLEAISTERLTLAKVASRKKRKR